MISLAIFLYCSNWFIPERCESELIYCIEQHVQTDPEVSIEETLKLCISDLEKDHGNN